MIEVTERNAGCSSGHYLSWALHSFDDTVKIDDIARAFEHALRDEIADKLQDGEQDMLRF